MQTVNSFGRLVICLFVLAGCSVAIAQDEIEGVRAAKRSLGPKLDYFLIGSTEKLKTPKDGYKLLIVMPGGDGSADFQPFIKNIYKNALDPDYLVIQLVAPKWTANQGITWPTAKDKVTGKKMPVEQFIAGTVEDVKKRTRIDPRHVYTLSWSSGGPAAYAASLHKTTPITGSFVAMSVFFQGQLPSLEAAKGKSYYIYHSPEDNVCKYPIAVRARDTLKEAGATVEFVEYTGGHGWHGDIFGDISSGIEWLESQAEKTPKSTAGSK
jgi:predicted esterase